MKKKNKMIPIVVCAAIILLFGGCGKNSTTTEFSADSWMSVDQDQRYRMLEDLYAKVELAGMSADEVEKLLGKYSISHEAYLSDEGKYDYHWGYVVRDDWLEGYEYLLINFKDDIVVDYELEYGSDL